MALTLSDLEAIRGIIRDELYRKKAVEIAPDDVKWKVVFEGSTVGTLGIETEKRDSLGHPILRTTFDRSEAEILRDAQIASGRPCHLIPA